MHQKNTHPKDTQKELSWHLVEAAARGHQTIMQLLLSAKALPNVQNKKGQLPLNLATAYHHTQIIPLLLHAGANPNQKDGHGTAPLHQMRIGCPPKVARLLLENKADPNIQNSHQTTPLHTMTVKGHARIVKLLLEYKALPHLQNKNGNTPLHWAAKQGHLEITGMLLNNQADPTSHNHNHNTPLDFAIQHHHLTVQTYLINAMNSSALLSMMAEKSLGLFHINKTTLTTLVNQESPRLIFPFYLLARQMINPDNTGIFTRREFCTGNTTQVSPLLWLLLGVSALKCIKNEEQKNSTEILQPGLTEEDFIKLFDAQHSLYEKRALWQHTAARKQAKKAYVTVINSLFKRCTDQSDEKNNDELLKNARSAFLLIPQAKQALMKRTIAAHGTPVLKRWFEQVASEAIEMATMRPIPENPITRH